MAVSAANVARSLRARRRQHGRRDLCDRGNRCGRRTGIEVQRFDGKEWRDETRLLGEGLNAPAAVAIGNRIYVIGGFNTVTNVPSSDVLVYDIETRSWSTAAPLPAPRGGHAAAVLNGRIHVIGGGNSRSTLADHSEYDPAADKWTERAPLSRSKGSPAAVAFDGKLYAIGRAKRARRLRRRRDLRSGERPLDERSIRSSRAGRREQLSTAERSTCSAANLSRRSQLSTRSCDWTRSAASGKNRCQCRRRGITRGPSSSIAPSISSEEIQTVGMSHSSAGSTLVERFKAC